MKNKRSAVINKTEKSKDIKVKPIRFKVPRTHKPNELSLEEWQRILRKQYAEQQNYKLKNIGEHPIFSKFLLTNSESGKTYKIAIRGDASFDNYCSCPDYNINNLGTCKHIEFILYKLKKRKGARKSFKEGYIPSYSEVYLRYGLKQEARFKTGKNPPVELLSLANEFFDSNGILKEEHIFDFHQFLNKIPQKNGHEVHCYDDVISYIAEYQDAEHRCNIIKSQLKDGINSKIFQNLLKTELYTYQKEGVLFAINAGRCLISDDMGLGKTIQAIATAELMAKLFNIQKVLIVSPTSLKYQWKDEIEKFTDKSVCVIEGVYHQRKEFYRNDSFYKIINYELVFRDIEMIKVLAPDLIILDEAQRIKNWKTRTAKYVKQYLLKFKRSLFTGVLDNDGEDIVMIGESKLKKLMETVETISEDIKKTDTVFEDEQKELYKETDDTEQIVKKRDTDISLNDFLISGAKFLMNISKTISESNEPIEKHLHTMIGKDEKTGKSYLKIPLPEPEVINNIFSAISELISKTKTQ